MCLAKVVCFDLRNTPFDAKHDLMTLPFYLPPPITASDYFTNITLKALFCTIKLKTIDYTGYDHMVLQRARLFPNKTNDPVISLTSDR